MTGIGSAAKGATMPAHDELRLRAIVVSTRAALASVGADGDRLAVRERADSLLAGLEQDILSDGADPNLLARIATARRAVSH